VERFDVAVGLRAAGVNAAVARLQARGCGGEIALELVAVVREQALEAPVGGLQLV